MNDQSPDNLISAYFDGETTPTECEDAKRLLETSPEAKAEWEELEKLSRLISDVPRDRAPEEFPSEVMQHIERSMLLPDAEVAPPVSSAARRRWLPTVASLVASAAALFLLVQLIGTSDQSQTKLASSPAATQGDDIGGGAVANSNTAADAVAMDSPVIMDKGISAEEAFDADRTPLAEASPHARTRPAKNAVAASSTRDSVGKQKKQRIAQPHVAEFKATRSGNQNRSLTESEKVERLLSAGFGGGGSNLVFDSRMLEAAQIGQVVEALDRSSDQVTVVRLTVVDRRAGLEALKVLLARNQIPLDPNSEQADALSEEKKLTSPERSGDLIAMYVEATDVQLSSAFEDLKKGGVFQELTVESAITVAQLENSARSRRGNAHYFRKAAVQSAVVADKPQTSGRREKARESQAKDESSADRSRKPALAKSQNKKSNPRKRGFLADSKEAVVAKTKTTSDSESKVDQLARISRQLELSISKDVLGGFLKKARKTNGPVGKANTLARSTAVASKLSAAPQPQPAGGGGKGQAARSAKPLKVLIVLVAAPKNGRTSPTGPAARPAGKKADQAPPRKKDDGAAIFRRSPPHLS